ncbi:MAG: hypothetical protein OXE78_15015 [Gammaproteobacteria bacterium]|nr:hypothetical protein [Gammaproteobacteria bacterium]MCY4358281.1 hypothetical protein [Gammaproteobacteria bacterium]
MHFGKKQTSHGTLRIDHNALQAPVPGLLGYRWHTEIDAEIKLAEEQREVVEYCESLSVYADKDVIVCIPAVRGEASASGRLLNLLAAVYRDIWNNDTLTALLDSAENSSKTLEVWLREKFFAQHRKLFHHRQFIWQIWDGLRDGFSVLVNYHKLDSKCL